MSKYCKSCGAANTDSANVCTRCGKMLPYGGGEVDPMEQKVISGKTKKLLSGKNTKYGIGIAIICVVLIVVFVSLSNRGIVGTWESDEYFSERCNVRSIYTFKNDHTGYARIRPDYDGKGDYYYRWERVGDGKYTITWDYNNISQEITMEPGNKEFVLEGSLVCHRK